MRLTMPPSERCMAKMVLRGGRQKQVKVDHDRWAASRFVNPSSAHACIAPFGFPLRFPVFPTVFRKREAHQKLCSDLIKRRDPAQNSSADDWST